MYVVPVLPVSSVALPYVLNSSSAARKPFSIASGMSPSLNNYYYVSAARKPFSIASGMSPSLNNYYYYVLSATQYYRKT